MHASSRSIRQRFGRSDLPASFWYLWVGTTPQSSTSWRPSIDRAPLATSTGRSTSARRSLRSSPVCWRISTTSCCSSVTRCRAAKLPRYLVMATAGLLLGTGFGLTAFASTLTLYALTVGGFVFDRYGSNTLWATTFVIGVIVALGFIVLSVPARMRAQAMSLESGSPVPT